MKYMFNKCSSLNFLNLYNFNINNISDMNGIFDDLKKDCKIIFKKKELKIKYNIFIIKFNFNSSYYKHLIDKLIK